MKRKHFYLKVVLNDGTKYVKIHKNIPTGLAIRKIDDLIYGVKNIEVKMEKEKKEKIYFFLKTY